ncbi:WbqC family protein [Rhodopirellula sp. MGV]|uniref:WbqC family protein n=1 Tax=Rhodopirellula sp. MGV TaxID=2023130 RepID=UPI000B968FA5|nr:WbqC family protein [Rhodopirellula sp. MGV]OYP32368.1 hypothetical protein CGZ80_20085 [Rhodopirellula sp. MGV]PNY35848.1 hypothetical protein C2E31_15395 [Rhodopirellula baltica]
MENKTIAIMQPYFLPYIGYFHLVCSADVFVIYDNLKYTKRGWINRNRFLEHGSDAVFSIPLRKASDSLNIDQRELADSFDREKLLRRVSSAYAKAPHFDSAMALFESAVRYDAANLFSFLHHSLQLVLDHLKIARTILRSSEIQIDHQLSGQEKVIAICQAQQATTYINAIGGLSLYDEPSFANAGLDLRFIESHPRPYTQFDNEFVPWLSIIDLLMFNSIETVRDDALRGYSLISRPVTVA